MTLGISMLKNIFLLHIEMYTHGPCQELNYTFPLHTRTQNYHVKYLDVLH
jgi:hypothetical protein